MCEFFSCISDGKGNVYYFDHEMREMIRNDEFDYKPDGHTFIAYHFAKKIKVNASQADDYFNKYEYNPLTKEFVVDQLNTKDDSALVEQFCKSLDFKKIVPELIIHEIINPFRNFDRKEVTDQDIEDLKKWASVRASVRASVGDSVGASVGASVWDSV